MISAEFLECPYDDAIESNHEKDGQDDGTGDDEVGLVGAEVTFGQFDRQTSFALRPSKLTLPLV